MLPRGLLSLLGVPFARRVRAVTAKQRFVCVREMKENVSDESF